MPVNNLIQIRKGTDTSWTSTNPVLASGEPGYDLTNNILKIGDGITSWNSLQPSNFNLSNYNIIGTGNINIVGNISAVTGTLDKLVFDTSLDDPTLLSGQLAWNPTEGTVDLGFTDTYAQHLGEELHYRVRNNTASTLLKGTVVYASGLTPGGNNRIEIAPFTADGSIREVRFMGLVTENISNGVNGYTTQFGYIRGIDTRGDAASNGYITKLWDASEPSWSEGDILYAHPTAAGKLTKIEPKHAISVAIILNRHQNQGKIFVRPTSYGHLSDNHDVNISGVSNGQFLQYNSSTDYWVPSSSGNFTSLQLNGTTVSISGHTHTSSQITDFNSSVSGLISGVYAPLSGKLNQFASTTSEELFSVISNETGSGILVFNTNPVFSGSITAPSGNFTSSLQVNNTGVSLVGHAHTSSDITNFNESVDDRVSSLLVGVSGIYLSYNDSGDSLNIAYTGSTSGPGGGLNNIVEDTSPQLGGNLDLNGYSVSGIGSVNIANSISSSPTGTTIGSDGYISQSGQTVLSQGSFGSTGDAQFSQYLLRNTTSNNSWTPLKNNGSNAILLTYNRTYSFTTNIIARSSTSSSNAGYKLEGLLYHDSYGVGILGTPIKTIIAEDDTSWDIRVSISGAGTGGINYLLTEVSGSNSHTINWLAKVDLLEVGTSNGVTPTPTQTVTPTQTATPTVTPTRTYTPTPSPTSAPYGG